MMLSFYIGQDMWLAFWIGTGSASLVLGLAAICGMIVDERKARR